MKDLDGATVLKILTQKTRRKIPSPEAFSNFKRIGGVESPADILLIPLTFTIKYDGKIHKARGDVTFADSMSPTESFIYLSVTEKDVEVGFG